MKTLTKAYAKRALSLLLAAVTLLSLGMVGLTSASAANTQLAETGLSIAEGANLYCFNSYKNVWRNDAWNDVKMTYKGNRAWEYAINDYVLSNGSINFSFATDYYKNAYFYYPSDKFTFKPTGEGDTDIYKCSEGDNYNENLYWILDLSSLLSQNYYSADIYIKFDNSNNTDGKVQIYINDLKKVSTSVSNVSLTVTAAGAGTVGDTLTLTAGATVSNGSGNTTYDFYVKAPGESKFTSVQSASTLNTCSYIPTTDGVHSFYVKATNNGKSAQSDTSDFYVNPAFSVSALLSDSTVYAGQAITVTATTELTDATYTLTDSNGIQVGESNTDGIFTIDTASLTEGDYTYTVTATGTSNGKEYTATTSVSFTVKVFTKLIITPTYPENVECGSSINITASANTSETVTYKLTDSEGKTIGTNTTGSFSVPTTTEDKNTEISFTLTATATVNGTEYTDEKTFKVEVTEISETTEITIYFKSSSTYGYAPVATVKGVYETKSEAMTKDTFIRTNETNTADYWWYSITTTVSSKNPKVSFNVKSGRYAMEATTTLTLTSGVYEYYFGVDNLNCGTELVNLTGETEEIKNFCESAVHMVYDPEYDGEETLAAVAATYNLTLNGDVNGDGKVNVRDATLLQKSLANAAELSATAQKVADFNLDGNVSIKDATAIQKQVAKL